MQVLLVEDNPDDALLLQRSLRNYTAMQFVFLHVDTMRDALAHVAIHPLDLILLDLSLPDATGLKTVSRMLKAAPHIPIIVLTGLDDDTLGTQAVQAGAQDYLVKGNIEKRLLLRCIRYAVERHRVKQQLEEEAAISAALATVGQTLISSASTQQLLDRLCRITTEVLDCAFTHTLTWVAGSHCYVPTAAYPPSEWERIQAQELSAEENTLLHALLHDRDVVVSPLQQFPHLCPPAVPAEDAPPRTALCLPLQRQGNIVGVQLCGNTTQAQDFSTQQIRIAKGLIHLASLALENTRLLEELEHSNEIKTHFAATMSHELRNTLSTITGTTDILIDMAVLPAESPAHDLLQRMQARAWESLDIIQATLELSRSEAQTQEQSHDEVVIAQLFSQLAQDISAQTIPASVAVVWQPTADLPPLHTDAIKLKMILKNLVGNALKFTEQGTILISAYPEDRHVCVMVSDTGCGIPSEAVPTLFTPFEQAHGKTSRQKGGAGLGLYIVSRLTHMLGGEIGVESTLGSGSTFTLRLPHPPRPAAEVAPTATAS